MKNNKYSIEEILKKFFIALPIAEGIVAVVISIIALVR